jgi:DNA-binding transcriptional MerR regulator
MSKYTTGELAKLCGVTVRTVQYYDTRGILLPTELSEGGRRLYSEDDLKRMKIICFLRELGLPLDSISQLLSEDDPGSVISLLIGQQEQTLRAEINERRTKLEKLIELEQELKGLDDFSIESIGDIASVMSNKKNLKKLRMTMLLTLVPVAVLQWGSIILWIMTGIWWPFLIYTLAAIPYAVWVTRYYFRYVAYICPKCHEVFKPIFKEALWARHTPCTRKLTCTCCGHHGFCVETYGGDQK